MSKISNRTHRRIIVLLSNRVDLFCLAREKPLKLTYACTFVFSQLGFICYFPPKADLFMAAVFEIWVFIFRSIDIHPINIEYMFR